MISIRPAIARFLALTLFGWPLASPAADIACRAASGEDRASLLELYTSEGCSSCPPADRWLSGLRGQGGLEQRLVPLALHVDYWKHLGWEDRFAKPEHSARQRAISRRNRSRRVYTPQFVLDGRDWGPSGDGLAGKARGGEPGADLELAIDARTPGRLTVTGEARLRKESPAAAVYLALYEDALLSRVTAGENAGRLLAHASVVRALDGPLAIPAAGVLRLRKTFVLGPDWKAGDLGAAAFVQDERTGDVLQALRLPVCGG